MTVITVYTTQKQSDLAAVSAQKFFEMYGGAPYPRYIQHYNQYHIAGTFSADAIRAIAHNSPILYNRNNQHMITDATLFNPEHHFFVIKRREPLRCTNQIQAFRAVMPASQTIEAMYVSDMWALDFSEPIPVSDMISRFMMGAPNTTALFAHPLCHTVEHLPFDALKAQLTGVVQG
jgi:hypothetical protein